MHAGRVLSLKRKHSLERARSRSRLQRGLTNGDLSRDDDDNANAPWWMSKWDERRSAFASAKNTRGLSLFHMLVVVALLGVGLMVGSLFVGPAAGLLEIGVSVLLFSIFCLIFVRCDGGEDDGGKGGETGQGLSDIVIEEKGGTTKAQDPDQNLPDDQSSSLLARSNPRKIPSPFRVFGYEMNFSPILECSEPGSSVSSFLTRNSSVPSRLANSSTADSLSRVSSKASCGTGPGGAGSPINEELEDFDYDQQLHLKLDLMDSLKGPIFDPLDSVDVDPDPDPDADEKHDAVSHDLLSLSSSNFSNYSASFDTDDSITADLSVVTVVERYSSSPNQNSNEIKESTSPSP